MNHWRYIRYTYYQLSPNSEFNKPCLTVSSAGALTRHRDAGLSPHTNRYGSWNRKKMRFGQEKMVIQTENTWTYSKLLGHGFHHF